MTLTVTELLLCCKIYDWQLLSYDYALIYVTDSLLSYAYTLIYVTLTVVKLSLYCNLHDFDSCWAMAIL